MKVIVSIYKNAPSSDSDTRQGEVTTLISLMRYGIIISQFFRIGNEKEEFFMQYEEVLKMIAESEKRVDEMLKAARLERHEKKPMSTEHLRMIFNYSLAALAIVLTAIAAYMVIYFMWTAGH